jgi:hypothetical protein
MARDVENQERYLKNSALYPVADRGGGQRQVKSKAAGGARPPWFRELPKGSTRVVNRPEWQD